MQVLDYWRQGLWRTVLNDLPLSADLLAKHTQGDKSWTAPIVYKNETDNTYWIPLWVSHDSNDLPWFAPSVFQHELHEIDDWLRHEDKNDYLKLLEKLNPTVPSGFTLIKENISLSIQQLIDHYFPGTQTISPLLRNYADLEDPEPKRQLNQDIPNEIEAALYALGLEEGELLAIKTPLGADKAGLIKAIIAAKASQQSTIYLFTPDISYSQWQLQNQDFNDKGLTAQLLDLHHKELQLYSEGGGAKARLAQLQEEDERLEQEAAELIAQQSSIDQKLKGRALVSKLSDWMFSKKNILSEEITEINNEVRQLKVQRTKIHQELVEVVELVTLKASILRQWQEWLGNILSCEAFEAKREAIQSDDETWNASSKTPRNDRVGQALYKNWNLFKLDLSQPFCWQLVDNIDSTASLIIIDSSNRLLPQQVAHLLNQSQRAIFLGDNKALGPIITLSALSEEEELKKHQLNDDEQFEQLQYKGMLTGTGNAFTVALINSCYQKFDESGLFAADLKLNTQTTPLKEFFNVTGKSETQGKEIYNNAEIQAILKWIRAATIPDLQNNVLILTPFEVQKNKIKQALGSEGIACKVSTLDELNVNQWDYVIFSPVYTSTDRRPFIFDQGEQYLYTISSLARRELLIFGEQAIFNPRMHSPSGKFAEVT